MEEKLGNANEVLSCGNYLDGLKSIYAYWLRWIKASGEPEKGDRKMEEEKILNLDVLVKGKQPNNWFIDVADLSVIKKVLEVLAEEGHDTTKAGNLLSGCKLALLYCADDEPLRNYKIVIPFDVDERENNIKETLQKQLNLLLERSDFCVDELLAPITEQIIGISKILMNYDDFI